jgi:hypothetical protein
MTCACLLAKQAGGTLRMIVRVRALLVAVGAAVMASAAAAADCASEAAVLVKEQAELPRLEIVSSADRPPYCITLETIIAFAGRVKSQLGLRPACDRVGQDPRGLCQAVQPVPLPARAVACAGSS